MTTVLAWILCTLGWSIVVVLIRRNSQLRRELALALLRVAKEPMFGRDLVKLSGGALRPGTVYVTLHDLEDDGLVLSDPCLGDLFGLRVYAASDRGAQLHRDRLAPHRLIEVEVGGAPGEVGRIETEHGIMVVDRVDPEGE